MKIHNLKAMPDFNGPIIDISGQPNFTSNKKVRITANKEEKLLAPVDGHVKIQHPYAEGLILLDDGVDDP